MAIQTSCPNCEATYTLADTQRGKKVRCRKCSEIFTVGGAKDADAPEPVVAKSGKDLRKPKDALQSSPRPPAKSTPPPKTKPAAKRARRRDDDDDDDDDDRSDEKPSVKKKAKSSTPMVLMVVGGILLVLLLCGGGGTFAVYWWVSSTVKSGFDDMAQNMPQPNGLDPNFPLADLAQPKDLNEALDWVKNGDANKKNKGADWLSKANVDDGRQKEVAAELEKLIDNPNTKEAGMRALVVWAGPDDAPALLKEIDSNGGLWVFDRAGGAAADALVRFKYEPAAAVFAKHLSDFAGGHGAAARRLAALGPIAEKEVLKYMDSANNDARGEALGLLRQYGMKPDVMFDQAVADLKSGDSKVARQACDYIATTPVNEARRAEISKALETPLADGTDAETRKAAAVALKTWGTKDNVPALIAELDNKSDPFHKTTQACMEALGKLKDERGAVAVAARLPDPGFTVSRDAVVQALRDMGPVAEKAVAAYVTHPDQGVRAEAEKLLKFYGTKGDVRLTAAVADLDAADANQRKTAVEYLATQPVDDAHQKEVARALDRLLDDPEPFGQVRKAAAKAEVVWGDKDSVPALVKGMERENSDIWRECMDALARIKDEKAVVPLILQTAKGKPHIQDAQRALIQMGPVVETGLDGVLTDPAASTVDKITAIQLLSGQIGTKASVPALTAAAGDADPKVKAAAAAALKVVQKRNP